MPGFAAAPFQRNATPVLRELIDEERSSERRRAERDEIEPAQIDGQAAMRKKTTATMSGMVPGVNFIAPHPLKELRAVAAQSIQVAQHRS